MSKIYIQPSKSVEWETPQYLYDELNREFMFDLDAAATKENTKHPLYFYTLEDDSLKQSWDEQRIWCNPPYGRQIKDWVKKASEAKYSTVVMLVPARTDTKWFHEYVYNKPNVEIRFIKGRLKFGGNTENAPFPNMIVIFRPTPKDVNSYGMLKDKIFKEVQDTVDRCSDIKYENPDDSDIEGLLALFYVYSTKERIAELRGIPWKRSERYKIHSPYITKAWLTDRISYLESKGKTLI